MFSGASGHGFVTRPKPTRKVVAMDSMAGPPLKMPVKEIITSKTMREKPANGPITLAHLFGYLVCKLGQGNALNYRFKYCTCA